jgi:hypothetical protein
MLCMEAGEEKIVRRSKRVLQTWREVPPGHTKLVEYAGATVVSVALLSVSAALSG